MKKQKRPAGFDEQPDLSNDIDMDMEDLDEDIIDLEDIIEMPAGSIDEDEDLDLDVEILDAEPDLDFDMLEKDAAGAAKLSKEPPMEDFSPKPSTGAQDDLVKSFDGDLDDDEDLFETLMAEETGKKPEPVKKEEKPKAADSNELLDQSLLDELLAEEAMSQQSKAPSAVSAELKGRAAAEKVAEKSAAEAVPPPQIEPQTPVEIPKPATTAKLDDPMIGEYIDELIAHMGTRLIENVRQMVEARLPEVVREVIREEIEKIKKEMG